MPKKTKTVFTTGEVARICKMNVMTVNRRFDDGTLKGYKLPKSGVRRVPYKELVAFIKTFGIPMEFLAPYGQAFKVLLAAGENECKSIRAMLGSIQSEDEIEIYEASNTFQAGRMFEKSRPDLLIIDLAQPDIGAKEIIGHVRAEKETPAKIIGISSAPGEQMASEVKLSDLDAALTKPIEAEAFKRALSQIKEPMAK
jgi:CheY-like chemotaxis protein